MVKLLKKFSLETSLTRKFDDQRLEEDQRRSVQQTTFSALKEVIVGKIPDFRVEMRCSLEVSQVRILSPAFFSLQKLFR